MEKFMKLKQIFAAATLAVSSTYAFATPIYQGDTDASGFANSALTSGYTIWNGEGTDNDDWSVRWTSKNANNGSNVDWFGSIVFYNSLLDTTSTTTYQWENSQDTLNESLDNPFLGGGDALAWSAITNDTGGVDGFNFSLDQGIELLEFKLGSSLFAGLGLDNSLNGTDATMISIGDQGDNVKVNVSSVNGNTYQHVQVSVSEPGTLALLGLGIAALGFSRRKQA
ncbi:MAG: hypothetical protein ACI84K_001962 [Pseudohongiellaceae bacterium]|jgi:hypothetical protein